MIRRIQRLEPGLRVLYPARSFTNLARTRKNTFAKEFFAETYCTEEVAKEEIDRWQSYKLPIDVWEVLPF